MLGTLVILATLGYCTLAAPNETPGISPFIVGGTAVPQIKDIPYIASVQVNITGTPLCGGVIITPRWIITAAHCAEALDGDVRAGSIYWASGGVTREVKDAFVNENWDPVLIQNDIALLKLKKPLIFSKNIRAISLPRPSSRPPGGQICEVSGWGWIDLIGPNPDQLYVATVPITDQATCQEIYADINPVTDDMICTGDDTTYASPCLGDSGGPLVCKTRGRDVVVGTVSWGVTCGDPAFPLVYTAIGAYVKWIAKTILTNIFSAEERAEYDTFLSNLQ